MRSSTVPGTLAISLTALVASCWSFSAAPGGTDAGPSTGTGGAGAIGQTSGAAGTMNSSGGGTGIGNASGTGSGGTGSGGTGSGGTGSGGTGIGAGGSGGTDIGAGGSGGTGIGAGGSGNAIGSGGAGARAGMSGGGGSVTLPGSGGISGVGGAGTGGASANSTPCSILAAAGNGCAAAHSTVRVVYPGYSGPLYQVCKGSFVAGPKSCSSGMTKDIGSVAGGYADSATQDAFCSGGACTISIIYDQSPNGNHLHPSPAGQHSAGDLSPVSATALKTTLNGHTVYGVLIKPATGYRAGCKTCAVVTPTGTATNDQPETEYMVTSQNDLVDGCCFDYGNAEIDSHADGNGTMETVYFGGGVVWGTGSPGGHANGPWVMADLENGIYAGWQNNQDQNISTNTPLKFDFVTAVLVGDTAAQNAGKGRLALYGSDATAGTLKTLYDGIRPAKTGYVPAHKQGSIVLGSGGDTSDTDGGRWFEGVMASGAASLATLNAVQANIVAAGYGK
jgi:Alpha-L-arabinofuranosidase B, catalytic